MKYYKVVNAIDSEAIIDTEKTNYSTTLVKRKKLENIIEFIVNSSEKLDLPLDMYFTINNSLVMQGEDYLRNFPKAKNGIYRLSDFITLNGSVYSKYTISENELVKIIEGILEIGLELFNEGFYLWEYLYEKLRTKSSPCRYNSFFLFDSKKDCEFYIQNHKGGGTICEVELINTKSLFKADMNLLDSVENYNTYNEAKEIIQRYWNEDESKNAIFEYLFQGKCKLIPIE